MFVFGNFSSPSSVLAYIPRGRKHKQNFTCNALRHLIPLEIKKIIGKLYIE